MKKGSLLRMWSTFFPRLMIYGNQMGCFAHCNPDYLGVCFIPYGSTYTGSGFS